MYRKTLVLLCLVTMVATAGCAAKTTFAPPTLVTLTDGKVLEATTVVSTDPFGHDLTVQRGRECEVAEKDGDKVTKTKNCGQAYVEKQGGPNIGQVVVDSAINAAAIVGGAAALGATMPKPGKTTIHGSSATGGTSKASSGSTSTGALTGSGASVTTTVQNP